MMVEQLLVEKGNSRNGFPYFSLCLILICANLSETLTRRCLYNFIVIKFRRVICKDKNKNSTIGIKKVIGTRMCQSVTIFNNLKHLV